MSKYTTEVRFICETLADLKESEGYDSINLILEKSAPKIFSFDYPIFDESYRLSLEKKILKHFYTREIGFETVGLWKLKLDDRMNMIMPYYNQLYKSALIEFNPMYDIDLTTDHTLKHSGDENGKIDSSGTNHTKYNETYDKTREGSEEGDSSGNSQTNGTTNTTGNSTSKTVEAYSDTPQGSLQNIENNTYLTNGKITNNTGSTTNKETTNVNEETTANEKRNNEENENGSRDYNIDGRNSNSETNSKIINSLDDYIQHVKGKNGGRSYSKMLMEFRETFMNIDAMVVDELKDLFFKLW